MKKRIALVLGVVALAGVALTAAFYVRAQGTSSWQGRGGWHGRGGRPSIERIVDHIGNRLDLTSEQKAQVNSVIAAERPKQITASTYMPSQPSRCCGM